MQSNKKVIILFKKLVKLNEYDCFSELFNQLFSLDCDDGEKINKEGENKYK